MIWLQRVGRQRLADHRLDGLLGVTNFDISMAASLAGVALAEVLVWPSVLMLMAKRCRSRLGGAAASLAALLQRSLAPHDGLQLLSQWVALHGCARRADCCTELLRAVPYSC